MEDSVLRTELAQCRAQIEQAAAGLDDVQGSVRVDGRWSIAEIVEHLDRTYTGTVKGLERCLEAGGARVTPATMRTRLRKLVVVRLGFFPTGIEAPKHVVPSGRVGLAEVLSRVASHLVDMDGALLRAADRFGKSSVMDHPILGPFSVEDWARFHLVHTRHHCRQIAARRRTVAESSRDHRQ
jgi:hypothetical protein